MDIESVIERLDCVGHSWFYYPLFTIWWVSTWIIMFSLPTGLSSMYTVYTEAKPEAVVDEWLISFAGDLLNVAGYMMIVFSLFLVISAIIDVYYFGRYYNLRRQ